MEKVVKPSPEIVKQPKTEITKTKSEPLAVVGSKIALPEQSSNFSLFKKMPSSDSLLQSMQVSERETGPMILLAKHLHPKIITQSSLRKRGDALVALHLLEQEHCVS